MNGKEIEKFHFFLLRVELHNFTPFKPNFFSGGGPPDPPQQILQNQKLSCQMRVCLERG